MDLDAVRTFVAAADAGRFSDAADDLAVTQQAVSKRVAALEKHLGVPLFTRTARGARLTADGRAFLPHARALLQAEDRAVASVRRRPLRVDVVGRRLAPATLLRDFHRAHPAFELEVVTLPDAAAAIEAIRAGALDAAIRAVTTELPDDVEAVRVHDEPVQLVTGPDHVLAAADWARPADLAGHWIWLPGVTADTEWGGYYSALAAEFGFTLDAVGPDFGTTPVLEAVAGSSTLATFAGEGTQLFWPPGYDLRRLALRDPTPVYPHSLLWRGDNAHPALDALRGHLGVTRPAAGTWTPVQSPSRCSS